MPLKYPLKASPRSVIERGFVVERLFCLYDFSVIRCLHLSNHPRHDYSSIARTVGIDSTFNRFDLPCSDFDKTLTFTVLEQNGKDFIIAEKIAITP